MDPKPNQIVYNRNGARAKFIAKVDNYYFVTPEIEITNWEGEIDTDWGDAVTWHEIYPKAPTEVLDAEITHKEKEIEDLVNKARKIHQKITEGDTLINAQKDKFARYEQLRYLEDFIDGKITHIVRLFSHYSDSCSGVRIQEFKEGISRKDENDYYTRDQLKFVTLFGDTKGNLNFEISKYGDSGNGEHVIPCKSYEEAVAVVQKMVDDIAKELENGNSKGVRDDFFTSISKLGVNIIIPANITAHFTKIKEDNKLKQLERARESLEKVKKEVADLEAGIPSNAPYPPAKAS